MHGNFVEKYDLCKESVTVPLCFQIYNKTVSILNNP